MNILALALDVIDVGDRLRAIDEDYARLIAASMAEQGQMTPIEVRATPGGARPYALVAGGHRMRAAAIAGLAEVAAVLFDGSALQARLREIDENLVRRELSELDRGSFLAQRKAVWEELHPETRHGGDRSRSKLDMMSDLLGRFTAEAAERMGLSEKTIRRALTRHKCLPADVRAAIASTWLAESGTQLDALGRCTHETQLLVAAEIPRHPGVRRVQQLIDLALDVIPLPADPVADRFDAFQRLWRRMSAAERERVREFINPNPRSVS